MAGGCRDCRTCTKSVIGRFGLKLGYAISFTWLIKPLFMRNCPECKHVMRRHMRRADGSFQD
jgi:hypothetical protein